MRRPFLLFYFSMIIICLLILNFMSCCSYRYSVKERDNFFGQDSLMVESFHSDFGNDSSESSTESNDRVINSVGHANHNHLIVGNVEGVIFNDTIAAMNSSSNRPRIFRNSSHNGNNEVGSVPVVNEIESKDELGVIAYNIPDTMKVGVEYIVRLRISKKMSGNLTVGLGERTNNLIVSDIRVGNTMEVKLIETSSSEESFKIASLSSGIQNIEDDSSYTTWEWSIRPIKGGIHKLKMIVVIKGDNFTKDIPVYENEIYIQNSSIFIIKDFLSKNWQWLSGSIFIPLIVFSWKKREEDKPNKRRRS